MFSRQERSTNSGTVHLELITSSFPAMATLLMVIEIFWSSARMLSRSLAHHCGRLKASSRIKTLSCPLTNLFRMRTLNLLSKGLTRIRLYERALCSPMPKLMMMMMMILLCNQPLGTGRRILTLIWNLKPCSCQNSTRSWGQADFVSALYHMRHWILWVFCNLVCACYDF